MYSQQGLLEMPSTPTLPSCSSKTVASHRVPVMVHFAPATLPLLLFFTYRIRRLGLLLFLLLLLLLLLLRRRRRMMRRRRLHLLTKPHEAIANLIRGEMI